MPMEIGQDSGCDRSFLLRDGSAEERSQHIYGQISMGKWLGDARPSHFFTHIDSSFDEGIKC